MNSKTLYNVIRAGAVAVLALGTSVVAFAQSATTTTTPGVPSTGLGGMASTNILLLLLSVSLVAMGIMIARKAKTSS